MRAVRPAPRSRLRTWFALLLVVIATVAAVSGCGARQSRQQVLVGKGTPYVDLLVPKWTSSVKDGAVGVPVDQAVTLAIQGEMSF